LDLVMARRRLQSIATDAFLEYALAERTYALAREDHRLAREQQLSRRVRLTSAADSRSGPEPTLEELDELELEILELDRSRDQLERARATAVRRVNTLLRRDPREPLPAPRLPRLPDEVPAEAHVLERAMETRPELAAARTREQSAMAQVALSYKDFYPDFILVGRFDTNADQFWWPEKMNIRPQLGFNLYAPVQQRRRWARVRQTEAQVRNERARRQIAEDEIRKEIREVYADLEYLQRRRQTLDRMVAAAERRVNARDEWVVLSAAEQTTELIAARRKLLKYQLDQLTADFQWHQHLVRLHHLSGADWDWGELPALADATASGVEPTALPMGSSPDEPPAWWMGEDLPLLEPWSEFP
jgi:outer membrane protein TolC